ncbi:MAG TPA: 4Fe-4S binding protein [Anaeromyxobacteraceae bacterium]|nr:4Fe-4S binding protein [Anaeromyxobacteraceae bacterium]
MLRELPRVEPDGCNACGSCIAACPQEALQMFAGHPRLVNDALCLGDGLCVEACGGALELELREAAPFDRAAVDRRRETLARLRALSEED